MISSGTSQTSATATSQANSCVPWQRAAQYVGKDVCICGTGHHIQSSGNTFFVHRDAGSDAFYGYSYKWYWEKGVLEGKCVLVCGTVETNYGRPRILIDEPKNQLFGCE